MRYATVVFDLGGVVVQWDPAAAVAGRWPRERWREAAAALRFAELNARADAGEPYARLRAEVAREHVADPALVELYDHYLAHVGDSFPGPVPGTSAVVEDLLEAGVRVLGLTNWSAETVHHAARVAPVVARFEALVVSGREGVTKPDPRLFEILLRRHEVDAGTALFVDDSAANVATARGLGMHGHVFTDADGLRRALTGSEPEPARH